MVELTEQDRLWMEEIGKYLNWTNDEYRIIKETLFRDGVNCEGLANLRKYSIEGIMEIAHLYPNIGNTGELYSRIELYADDNYFNLVYDAAFAEAAGILSRNEIDRLLAGKHVSEQAITKFPLLKEQLELN